MVVEGTRGRKSLPDLLRQGVDDVAARRRLGPASSPVVGPRGSGFIEDLTCFHKRVIERKPRWMLGIEYTLCRR